MTGGKQQQDPTMDEILSSIRKIIEQDAAHPAGAATAAPSPAARSDAGGPTVSLGVPLGASPRRSTAPAVDDDVLLLTNLIQEPEAPPRPAVGPGAAPATPDAPSVVSPVMLRPTVGAAPVPIGLTPAAQTEPSLAHPSAAPDGPFQPSVTVEPPSDQPLAADPMRAAMDRLARAVKAAEPPAAPVDVGPGAPAGRTLEDVVSDLLRPMLREWIEKNLPPLVERVIAQELQRRDPH
jgi:cell pole-organizing protein PopZ